MPYVSYNRPLSQVGFRPMQQTHPAHAAAMSGLGTIGDSGLPSSDTEVPGTGQTVGDLLAIGYTADQINQLLAVAPSSYLDSPAGAAGVPNGTTLTYQASIGAHLFGSGGINDFLSAIAGALGAQGLEVVGSNSSTSGLTVFNIQLQLLVTGSGYAKPQDVQAVVDHAIYQNRGEMPMASSIAVTGVAGGGSAPAAGATSLTTWIEQNAMTIGLALAAILVLPQIVRKL